VIGRLFEAVRRFGALVSWLAVGRHIEAQAVQVQLVGALDRLALVAERQQFDAAASTLANLLSATRNRASCPELDLGAMVELAASNLTEGHRVVRHRQVKP
jgi:hypothetical protein